MLSRSLTEIGTPYDEAGEICRVICFRSFGSKCLTS